MPVSIQLISPASGNLHSLFTEKNITSLSVSIQLISPASGNFFIRLGKKSRIVSIQLISPASGNFYDLDNRIGGLLSFHSINIPSEWEFQSHVDAIIQYQVSIQLISPASGNPDHRSSSSKNCSVSIQLISPASGNPFILTPCCAKSLDPLSEGQQKSPPTSLQNYH